MHSHVPNLIYFSTLNKVDSEILIFSLLRIKTYQVINIQVTLPLQYILHDGFAQVTHLAIGRQERGRPLDGKMAGQSYGRNNVFRNNIRLVANNHWVQRHVVESVANQWR